MDELVKKIEEWAEARNLIQGATPAAQYEKLLEEIGELGRALIEDDEVKTIDAVGDSMVVLIILCAQKGLVPEYCLRYAYDQIKDRTGKMVDGIFVKDE
jgi:NTP pyrophosphatase (non-canonical NTP hydrolase)